MDYTPSTEAWIKMPLELLQRSGISKRAAILLSVIIRRCKYKRDLSAPITAGELITDSGMSRATIFRTIDELRALDLIRVKRTGRASVYTITPGCVELCPRAVQDDRPADHKPTPRASKKQRSSDSGTDYGAFIQAQEKRFLSMSDEEFAEHMSGSGSRTKRCKKAPTPEELAEMQEYLSLANRFLDAADEPLPGQTSFFDKEVKA